MSLKISNAQKLTEAFASVVRVCFFHLVVGVRSEASEMLFCRIREEVLRFSAFFSHIFELSCWGHALFRRRLELNSL